MEQVITPMKEDYSKWYTDVIAAAELADYAPVKGCMVIRPNGFAIWEKIQSELDKMIKETGHRNAYFPLFIPESFLKLESEHVEGFAPECAVVTHGGGKKLEENLYIRPTSETIMYKMYSKWIESWRDLPLLLNQWANIVRWEKRTRLFLRTSEFLWQEGHTAHATVEEAEEETVRMLGVYEKFVKDFMAIYPLCGVKSESEKFAGALRTYAIEAMMQDKKALQMGTSHNLGQNFSKPFDIKFQDEEGELKYVWQTSWGVSTRLIGAIVMSHADDKGLVIPPKLAPIDSVIVPIWKDDEQKESVIAYARRILANIGTELTVKLDDREEYKPGWKYYEWERKGVPVRIEIGPKEVEKNMVVLVRRDTGDKRTVPKENIASIISALLNEIQENLYEKSKSFLESNTFQVSTFDEFTKTLEKEGGFIEALWCGQRDCEEEIKEKTKATIRCLPKAKEEEKEKGKCVHCGKVSDIKAVFGRAY